MKNKILTHALMFKNRYQNGFATMEFVIIAPILVALWYFLISINESIEHKQMLTIAASNIGHTVPGSSENLKVSGQNNSTSQNMGISKQHMVNLLSNFQNTSTTNSSPQFLKNLENNQEKFSFNVSSEFKDRSVWADERNKHLSATGLIPNSEFYSKADEVSANLSQTIPKLFDFLKTDTLPFLISDKKSIRKTQVEASIPSIVGLLPVNDAFKLIGSKNEAEEKRLETKYDLASVYFVETETGYHPTKNINGPLLGIALGLGLGGANVRHWSSKSNKTSSFESFVVSCLYHMSADDSCKNQPFGGNDYAKVVKAVVIAVTVANVIKAAGSLGFSEIADSAKNIMFDEAIDVAVTEVVDFAEKKVLEVAEPKVQELQNKLTGALVTEPINNVKNSLGKHLDEFTNVEKNIQNLVEK